MSWRCQECDYLGEDFIENEEREEKCPECRGDCIEVDIMTKEQEKILTKFFTDNLDSFINPYNKPLDHEEAYYHQLLWEDFKASKEIAERENVYTYTVVECDGEEAWLIKDWHFVNRIGYFFTTKKINIPEEGLRYW